MPAADNIIDVASVSMILLLHVDGKIWDQQNCISGIRSIEFLNQSF